jgi:hypothetical protein
MIRAEDLIKKVSPENKLAAEEYARMNIKGGEEFAINSRKELYEALMKSKN